MNKIAVTSLGCNKNLVDTEVMLAHLKRAGCEVVGEPGEADCLLVNTCSFLREAVEESLDCIVELGTLKQGGRVKRQVVAGCMVSRYGDQILREVPEVDALVPHTDLESIVRAVTGSSPDLDPGPGPGPGPGLPFPPRVLSHPSHRAYLKIAEGCSNWCSYCKIPSIRGEFVSRPSESILSEMRYLLDQGVREITLVAQDSGRYGSDAGEGSLASLIRSAVGIPGDYWLRVLYVHPARVTPELLQAMGSDPRICPYLDIPFQHVSPPVLERMGRGLAPPPMQVVRAARAAMPGLFLRTTLMTGFPGETEEDFRLLLHFLTQAGIDHLGVFAYSLEEGTEAAAMSDQVPAQTARDRADLLMQEQAEISARKLSLLVGRELAVLSEGADENGPYGRHRGQAPEVDGVVRLDRDVEPGTFIRVRITGSDVYDLEGEVMEQSQI
ncbi:MAG: 30S ribosomal protein S12 methylthiotransferase RimO [bacterium]|nr:MAG: 30S ribosomal protein S12 methylthiotransferase RimO [bacterium]